MSSLLIICCGGLGHDQTDEIQTALRQVPGGFVYSPGTPSEDTDDYKMDVLSAVRVYPAEYLALIGHSFGGSTVLEACRTLVRDYQTPVHFLGLLDPVRRDWGNTHLSENEKPLRYRWFRRSQVIGPKGAEIGGLTEEVIPDTDHNSLCHTPYVINELLHEVMFL